MMMTMTMMMMIVVLYGAQVSMIACSMRTAEKRKSLDERGCSSLGYNYHCLPHNLPWSEGRDSRFLGRFWLGTPCELYTRCPSQTERWSELTGPPLLPANNTPQKQAGYAEITTTATKEKKGQVKIGLNSFTASCENTMSLSAPGIPAPCEKFPQSVIWILNT
jgi:hypothetical protein